MDRPEDYDDQSENSLWDMEASSGADCDCPGPPPEFLLPPPPRPPFLQPPDPMFCTEDPLPIETCDALPVSQTLTNNCVCTICTRSKQLLVLN